MASVCRRPWDQGRHDHARLDQPSFGTHAMLFLNQDAAAFTTVLKCNCYVANKSLESQLGQAGELSLQATSVSKTLSRIRHPTPALVTMGMSSRHVSTLTQILQAPCCARQGIYQAKCWTQPIKNFTAAKIRWQAFEQHFTICCSIAAEDRSIGQANTVTHLQAPFNALGCRITSVQLA